MSLPGIQGRIGIRPGRLILLLVGFLGVWVWLRLLTPCNFGERAALAKFPQYGDLEVPGL